MALANVVRTAWARKGGGGGFDDMPRRLWCVGSGDELLGCIDKPVVAFPVLPILRGDPPMLMRIFLQFLEMLLLHFPVQMHPELKDQCAVIRQCLLEGERPLNVRNECLLAYAAIDPADQRCRIPCAQIQPDLSLGRQVAPIAPEPRSPGFLVGWDP